MLKKIIYPLSILTFTLASSSAIADQETYVMADSGDRAVQSSNGSTPVMSSSRQHAMSSQQSMSPQPRYYGHNGLPAPKRYQPPPTMHLIFGGQMGYGYLQANDVSGYSKDNGNIFASTFIGWDYMWNSTVSTGVQIGYGYGPSLFKYKGEGSNSDIKVRRTQLIPLLATLRVELPWNFNVFAKGGVAYVNQAVDNGTDTVAHINYNGVLSGGIGYTWSNFDLFTEYMYVFGNDDALGDVNRTFPIGAITLGLSYRLPLN